MTFKPEDIISDTENFAEISGVRLRKGTFGALLANAKIFCDNNSPTTTKQQAKTAFAEIIPTMVAIDLHNFITWKHPELQKLMEEAVIQMNTNK